MTFNCKCFKFFNAKNNDRKSCSNKTESKIAKSLIGHFEAKCDKQSTFLNLSDNNSKPLLKYTYTEKIHIKLIKFTIKVMIILICIFIFGFLLGNPLTSSFAKSDSLINHSSSHNPHVKDNFNAERYSVNKNSSLFYDLSLYDDLNEYSSQSKQAVDKKSIYFQFIKPSSANQIKKPPTNQQIYLQRFMLNSTFCNDGTRSGYYFRKGKTKNFIIFLEGGWFCYSLFTCHQR